MEKWEYKTIIVLIERALLKGQQGPTFANVVRELGTTAWLKEMHVADDFLTGLGMEGWELVGVSGQGSGQCTLFFKRRLQ